MFRVVFQGVVGLSGLASLLGLYFTLWTDADARPVWHMPTILVGSLFFVGLLVQQILETYSEQHKRFTSEDKINKYMQNLMKRIGHAAILSRDLSWASDPVTKSVMISKAKKGELTIFMQESNEIADELKAAGAKVHFYAGKFNPNSRFTILGFGQDGNRVAVGSQKSGKRIVYEYDVGEHPIAALCNDMINLLRRVSTK